MKTGEGQQMPGLLTVNPSAASFFLTTGSFSLSSSFGVLGKGTFQEFAGIDLERVGQPQ
jgi:hypothetical protein